MGHGSEETAGERTPGHERQEREGQVIIYKFYRKPMRNKMTILKRSAQPENMKVATMSSEIVRRLKTTSEFLSKDTFCDILETFMDELAEMGYGLDWRKRVLVSSIRGYMRVLRKVENGEVTRNREGYMTKGHRRYKKFCGKTEWFEDQEDEREWERMGASGPGRHQKAGKRTTEGVIFIPHTPGSYLKKRMN